jgi:hypothetical protein
MEAFSGKPPTTHFGEGLGCGGASRIMVVPGWQFSALNSRQAGVIFLSGDWNQRADMQFYPRPPNGALTTKQARRTLPRCDGPFVERTL